MNAIARKLAELHSAKQARRNCNPALEIVYYELLKELLKPLEICRTYFAVGSAANYSLLYLIARVMIELRPGVVLDIGCGQSTLLINDIVSHHAELSQIILSLDHDTQWASTISAQVDHRIVTSSLRPTEMAGRTVETYEWSLPELAGPFDFAIVDGPIGTRRYSRLGVLALADRMNKDFVIIMDDVDRPGERETSDLLFQALSDRGHDVFEGWTRAAKSQRVFACGAFLPAAYF